MLKVPLMMRRGLVAPQGLIGYWPFNANTLDFNANVARDMSGRSHTGTINGGMTSASLVAGPIKEALAFAAASLQYVDLGALPDVQNLPAASFSLWFKRSALNNFMPLGSNNFGGNDFNIQIWNDGQIYCNISSGIFGQFASNDTNLHHLAAVFDGTQSGNAGRLTMYLDSVLKTLSFTGTIPAATPASLGSFTIGRYNTRYAGGNFDDVRIYNRALSAADVGAIYQAGLAGRA